MDLYNSFKFENRMLEIELKNGEKNVYNSRGWDGYSLVSIEKVEAVAIFHADSCIAIYPFNAIAKLEVKFDPTAIEKKFEPNGVLMSESEKGIYEADEDESKKIPIKCECGKRIADRDSKYIYIYCKACKRTHKYEIKNCN